MTHTYFVRHTKRDTFGPSLRDQFLEEERFGIHFDDTRSLNPEDYTTAQGRAAIAYMNDMARTGAYVCASFWGKSSACMVGKVAPGSVVEIVGQEHNVCFKSLRLNDVRHLIGSDARRLLLLAPRQGTLRKWRAVQGRVEQWVRKGKVAVTGVSDLLYFEQEVMCGEFMRLSKRKPRDLPRLVCMQARVGGTQEAVDVSGVDEDNNWILAQVTNHRKLGPEVFKKAAALKEAGSNQSGRQLVMFCHTNEITSEDGVLYVPLDLVFEEMKKHRAWRTSVGML